MGFTFSHCLSGSAPVIVDFPLKSGTAAVAGSFVNLESGTLDEAATADTALVGIALQTKTYAAATDTVPVIINPDAVYSIVDANARLAGATLDLASDGSAIAASSNTDLIVVYPSSATEVTQVMVIRSSHYLGAAV